MGPYYLPTSPNALPKGWVRVLPPTADLGDLDGCTVLSFIFVGFRITRTSCEKGVAGLR